jgi:hypothetical protein
MSVYAAATGMEAGTTALSAQLAVKDAQLAVKDGQLASAQANFAAALAAAEARCAAEAAAAEARCAAEAAARVRAETFACELEAHSASIQAEFKEMLRTHAVPQNSLVAFFQLRGAREGT